MKFPKENVQFYHFFYFELPKWFVGGRMASHSILKTVRNVLVFKSRLWLAQIRSYRRSRIFAIFGSLT